MQKRQGSLLYEPIELPDDLPVLCYDDALYEEDDTRAGFGRHLHDILEIGWCRSGYGVYAVEAKLLPFQEGDLAVICPQESHHARSAPGVRSEWTWIFVDVVRLLGRVSPEPSLLRLDRFAGPDFNNILHAGSNAELCSLVQMLTCACRGKEKHRADLIRGLLLAFVAGLNQLNGLPKTGNTCEARNFERLLPALQAIHNYYHRQLRVTALAALCHMSASGFRHHFKQAMACSPMRYIQSYRISMASVELLQAHKTVEAVATDNGFPTLSCFVRQFTSQKGMPPRRWAKGERAG